MKKINLFASLLFLFLLASCTPQFQAVPVPPEPSEHASRQDEQASPPPEISEPEPPQELEEDFEPSYKIDEIDISLEISSEFAVTRPTDHLKTTYEAYFITGTSDPSQPVYLDDQELERQGSSGVFGILVELELGENTFAFSQGEAVETVTITREEADFTPNPIDDLITSSLLPAIQAGAYAGDELSVSCTAPSGAVVTATFDGESVILEPTEEIEEGLPVLYKGLLPIGTGYPPEATTKIGPVTYSMDWHGEILSKDSAGEVYIAGEAGVLAVQVNSVIGFWYPDLSDQSVFHEQLKRGSLIPIQGQNNSYFELAPGGFLSVAQASIVEGPASPRSNLTHVISQFEDTEESYFFDGVSLPLYQTGLEAEAFCFTLFHTEASDLPNITGSRLFEAVTLVENEEGGMEYRFTLKDNAPFWGYDVSFEETDGTLLRFFYTPVPGSKIYPLKDITILLDPGHGGYDAGAFGLPGKDGPSESDVNLAHAYAIGRKLAELGADVRFTRTEDVYHSLNARLEDILNEEVDFFLSVHHNSIREDARADEISGVEMYYHTPFSQHLADSILEEVTGQLERTRRFVQQSYYRVTLLPYAPAILMELGYMSNPLEYEKITDPEQIDRVASAVADGVIRALQPKPPADNGPGFHVPHNVQP